MSKITRLLAYLTFSLFVVSGAKAEDPWANSPNKSWYDAAEPTDAAKKQFGINKCCAAAEVVRTEFRHKRDVDEWWYLDRQMNTWRKVPDFIIWENKHPPENKPVLFIWNNELTCFFAPEDEI